MTRANNSLKMKETNKLRVLGLIREREISRADIARATGLSRAAITFITDELIKEGLICEGEAKKSQNGRRPTMLKICSDAYLAVGIDINRDACNVTVVDFSSFVRVQCAVELGADADMTVQALVNAINHSIDENLSGIKVLGVGICCPGPIDRARGAILNPPGLEVFHNYTIVDKLRDSLGLPVYLEKDTNALALAQKNAAHIGGDFLYLLADHGLGCSYVKDGKVFSGRGGMGCEIGHVTIKLDGERCRCGNIGCAELYASIPAALTLANKKGVECDSWEGLVSLCEADDKLARSTMREYGEILATACVGAVNLFEPDYIVLGGKLKEAENTLRDAIEQAVDQRSLSRGTRKVKVISSSQKEDSRATSAAQIVIEKYLMGE